MEKIEATAIALVATYYISKNISYKIESQDVAKIWMTSHWMRGYIRPAKFEYVVILLNNTPIN